MLVLVKKDDRPPAPARAGANWRSLAVTFVKHALPRTVAPFRLPGGGPPASTAQLSGLLAARDRWRGPAPQDAPFAEVEFYEQVAPAPP